MELSTDVLTHALGIAARRIISFRFDNIGYIALLSTSERYRPSHVRRLLTASAYNAADKGGVQIVGTDGIRIYTRSKRDKSDDGDQYSIFLDCVKKGCLDRNISLRKLLKDWPKADLQAPQATNPTADDQLAMREAGEAP